jgi:hypothetical protein
MSEDQKTLLFNAKIDQMLGLEQSGFIPESDIPGDSQAALTIASRLMDADFQSEIRPQPGLRARWISQNSQSTANSFDRKPWRSRWVWAALIGLVLIASLLIFRQPVLAAFGRLLGYGYFPQAGFVQLDTARILHNPVKQEHAGHSLAVISGLATPDETALWVEFSADPMPPDGAWLETSTGEKVMLRNWNWDPDQAGSRGIHLVFPPLPAGMDKMTLALPEGWRLPLEWIPAVQANIPSAEINAPYPTLQPDVALPTPQASNPCIKSNGLQVCLKAAVSDPVGTHLLLEANSQGEQLTPGSYRELIVPNLLTGDIKVILTDDLGNALQFPNQPFDPLQMNNGVGLQSLTFPSVSPQAQTLTLRVPAFEAQAALPDPLQLQVDLGANPQPGQSLTLDQELKFLGQAVRFRQATLEGDGVASLRLTLISDPIQPQNGLLVSGLELGKPEGIDDRYGSGSRQGQLRVFTELIGPISGKKTGLLTFSILGARFELLGPFEFTFPAPKPILSVGTPTPEIVGGESFTPQPSPTPLPLDTYHYTGISIEPGDVLFTVVGDSTTELYTANAQEGFTPRLVAVLPGQVYQVYIHPDRQGMDYLAGTRTFDRGSLSYRSDQVYTLNFASGLPKLLAAFPRLEVIEVSAAWSYDGRLMVLQQFVNVPTGEPNLKFGWIDLACRDTGSCEVHYMQIPAGIVLWTPRFSPKRNQLLFTGVSNLPDIFMIDFGSNGQPGPLSNLTNTDQTDEQSPQWLPGGEGFLSSCTDGSIPSNEYNLCRGGLAGGQNETLLRLPFNMQHFALSPDGKNLVDTTYVPAASQYQLRLFNLDTRQTSILKQGNNLNWDSGAFSPDSQYFSLAPEQGKIVTVINIKSGKEYTLLDTGKAGNISWVGWVK